MSFRVRTPFIKPEHMSNGPKGRDNLKNFNLKIITQ